MTYAIHDLVGAQPIATNSTVQNHALGTVVRATSGTYGAGEFIYLQGVAATAVGQIVQYDAAYVTAMHTTALDKPRPVAVAMSACGASEYGWYQISGQAVVKKAASVSYAAGAALAANATAGAIAVVSGLILHGAMVAVVASAKSGVTTVRVMLNRPHAPSDVS